MIASAGLSLTDWPLLRPPRFVGLENYATAFESQTFWKSLGNTFYFAGLYVPIGIVGSLCCALLLNQELLGRTFLRTVYFLPSVTPVVAATLLWIWIFNGQVGLANYLLALVGIQGPGWFASPTWSKPALIILELWRNVGGSTMIIFLAGLQGVPVELLEAAEIDGAGAWSKLWHITLPMLTPYVLLTSIMGLIGALQIFTTAYVAAAGGAHNVLGAPSESTLFYILALYRHAFMFYEMGYASALAWIFFLVVIVFTYLQFRLARRWVYYEAGTGGLA